MAVCISERAVWLMVAGDSPVLLVVLVFNIWFDFCHKNEMLDLGKIENKKECPQQLSPVSK